MKFNIQKRKRVMFYWKKNHTISQKLGAQTKKAIDDTTQPGASSWFSASPLELYCFALNKAEFRDAILLKYGKNKGLASYMSLWPEALELQEKEAQKDYSIHGICIKRAYT